MQKLHGIKMIRITGTRRIVWWCRHVLLGSIAIALTACSLSPESSFKLAADSRLPKWLVLPSDARRMDVDVTLDYFVQPSGRTFKATLSNRRGQVLATVTGVLGGLSPTSLSANSSGQGSKYPMYEVALVNGVPDIIEHRAMEPVFYMTDQPAVWMALVHHQDVP